MIVMAGNRLHRIAITPPKVQYIDGQAFAVANPITADLSRLKG
jgi:hypothetical protein